MDIFVRVANPVFMILLGLAAGVLAARLKGADWRLYGVGAAVFVGSQVFHIPFNQWVLAPLLSGGTEAFSERSLIFTAVALGLSAGVFEESARFLAYRFWIRNARAWKDALMFGAGHGGIEAILIGLVTLLSVIQLMALESRDLAEVVPADQLALAQAQLEAFWALPWYGVLLGAVERAVAICFHLAAAVLVLQAVVRRNALWWLAAVGFHAFLNALAVYGVNSWGIYVTEGALVGLIGVSLGIVWAFREREAPEEAEGGGPLPVLGRQSGALEADQLEDSRYV